MAVPSLVLAVLALALLAHAWPQLLFDEDDVGGSVTLPVIPFALSARSLPVVDEVNSMGTLPVPQRGRSLPVVDDGEGVLTLPVVQALKPGLVSREVELKLENRSDVAYYAKLDIGTPPQTVYAQLDTGSFELWVNPDCETLDATSDKRFCDAIGQYVPDDSSTVETTNKAKALRYGIGEADVTYVKDDITISGSTTLKGVQFGVATKSTDQFAGILGIGYGEGITTEYKNLIDELAAQGVTKTRAFSLALGGKHEGEGVIIFGGVDTAKFQGQLAGLPFIPADQAPDGVPRYWVDMQSVALTPPSGETKRWANSSMPVFLDSGATLTLLPPELVASIAEDFGAEDMDDNGFYTVDCGLMDMNGTVDFEFDGVTVKVPYKEMIREIRTEPPRCYLGIVPSETFTLLGDTFLRSAYVVFDLDSKMAYMAPYSNCGTNVSRINSSSDLKNLTSDCGREGSSGAEKPSATTTLGRISNSATGTPTAEANNPLLVDNTDMGTVRGDDDQDDGPEDDDSRGSTVEVRWSAIVICIAVVVLAGL